MYGVCLPERVRDGNEAVEVHSGHTPHDQGMQQGREEALWGVVQWCRRVARC